MGMLFGKMDRHRIGSMYEIQVNLFICILFICILFICILFICIYLYIVIGDHIKEGNIIILDINNSMNYSYGKGSQQNS